MGTLNVAEDFNKKLNIVDSENKYNDIVDYMNNFQYRTSYVNIDSRNRNIIPQNIIEYFDGYLINNPITTTADSFNVIVNITNHNLSIGDKIIIQNVIGNTVILNNPIYLIANFDYYLVHMDNHMAQSDSMMAVTINDTINSTDYIIGNIPINSITGIHNIYLYNNTFVSDEIKNNILFQLNITESELIQNYFFIKLPFNYININSSFSQFYNIQKIFKFQSDNIGGIKTGYINANYPINTSQYVAYHEITNVTTNYIEYQSPAIATYNETNGGNMVIIGKVINMIEGYPNANNYTISLKKTFSDVYSIEMVSCEMPYVDYNIKSNNNKLYWRYLEDGNYIYSITINEGFYFIDNLVTELKTQMNSIKRIISSSKETIYNDFDIVFNNNTQEIKFISYVTKILSYSLRLEQNPSLGSETILLTIKHPNNYVNVGDTIVISNSLDIGDIPATLINTSHTVYSVNNEAESYSVLLITTTSVTNIDGNGGAKTTIKSPALVSFMFNYKDTMGSLLGFKYVGNSTSITPFNHINSNLNDYIYITPFNQIGETSQPNNYFTFNGQNHYMLMFLNDYDNIYSVNNFNNSFAKIQMDGYPGDTMYNTHICTPLVFDIPIKSLSELKIKYLYPDGMMPDFRNLEHSFTLKIIERLSRPVRTGLNSMKSNYLEGLKEYAFDIKNS